ncbi:MAG TPA: hypothetical protein VEZ20_15260 [Allosphingosinicella sp.]|jgi:hypothetical protein|nr:hypothetical protein [Allosphingosinicella sp.]
MRGFALALAAAAAAFPGSADAGFPITTRMTCPIGGAPFDFTTTTALTTFGERPDGKPFASWGMPVQLPECPDNGLVLYNEAFDAAEVERLRALVASPDYQALRAGHGQYYRAAWLMRRMGAGEEAVLAMLVEATWEADDNPALRRRYLEELASGASALPAPATLHALVIRARGINALRELGRFDEARALFAATPLERFRAPLSPAVRGDLEDGEAKEQRRALMRYFSNIRRVVARRDASLLPPDMIGRRGRRWLCGNPDDHIPAEAAFCARRTG